MNNILEIIDKNGKIIYLTPERWSHIQQEHFDVSLQEIENTLLFPTKISLSDRDPAVKWFYKYYKNKREYLMVSIKYLNGKAFIITSHYVTKIQ